MKIRKHILNEAEGIVCSDREAQYGAPEDNFRLIGDLWGAYYRDTSFTAKDVAIMLALLKIARIRTGKHKLDNYIDIAGYAACAGEIADKWLTTPADCGPGPAGPPGTPGVLTMPELAELSADEYRAYRNAMQNL